MPILDAFKADGFSVSSLTKAINKIDYQPGRLGELGLFEDAGIMTTTLQVEEKGGVISLIQTSPRGGPGATRGADKRTLRSFTVPHLQAESTITADAVSNLRAFGQEVQMESIQNVVNERLAKLRRDQETTLEFHRVGALKGVLLDADGSTIYNLFTEFGVVQQTAAITFSVATTDIRQQLVAAKRLAETELGGIKVQEWHGISGGPWFDALVGHATVKEAFKYQQGQVLAADLRDQFGYAGVAWEEYRGSVSAQAFVGASEAYLVPKTSPQIFITRFAPADFVDLPSEGLPPEGLPIYAKQAIDPELQRWVKIHTQANPLCLCVIPRAVIKLTMN